MSAVPLLVEVVGRDGEVVTRQRIERLPATIGRGYGNDVIIDDPYVAPLHLTLEAAGEGPESTVIARDAGSRNGMHLMRRQRAPARWFGGGGERCSSIALDPQSTLRIGHTLLRVRRTDQPVAAELEDTVAHGWEGAPLAFAAMAGVFAIALVTTWVGDTEGREWLQSLRTVLTVVGGAALWAGVWAIFNRIFAQRLRFGRHLFIVACALIAAFIWEEVTELVAYALSFESLSAYNAIGGYAILAVAVYYHLTAIRPHRQRFARQLAVVGALALVTFSLVQNHINTHRLADELYLSALRPPIFRVVGDTASATFFEDAKRLKRRADDERKDEPGEDEGD